MADRGRFKAGVLQSFRLTCKECSCVFLSRSGNRNFCDHCTAVRSVCPECAGEKDIYNRFCGKSCAGKWNYRNSERVMGALKAGAESPQQRAAVSVAAKARAGKPNLSVRGPLNGNWKGGGKRRERQEAMGRIEYKLWREAVFKKDDFTCRKCGMRGGKLHAHHIFTWVESPLLRYDISNGATLCVPCHREHHRGPMK